MSRPDFNPVRLDLQACADAAASLRGTWPLAELPRLAALLVDGAGAVDWAARGERRAQRAGAGQIWLHLTAKATLTLQCQRCLAAVVVPVSVERSFLFVHG